MTTLDNSTTESTPVTEQETPTAPKQETSTTQTSTPTTVRNPEKLYELYEAQKQELKELKAFKASKDTEASQQEEDRLKKEQQYEALIPVKVKEATSPLEKQIAKLEKEKAEALEKLTSTNKEFEGLKTEIKVGKTKDVFYNAFLKLEDHVATPKETLWKLYGDQVKVGDDGIPAEDDLKSLFETLKSDEFGSRLFAAKVPSGSGTKPQNGKTVTPSSDKPRVVTKAQLLNPKKHGITMEDISDGKVVVEQD